MMNSFTHDQENPLLRNVPEYNDFNEIAQGLQSNPLRGIVTRNLSAMRRMEILVGEKAPLFPTTTSIRAGIAIIGMHRSSLRARNPTMAESRRLVHQAIVQAQKGPSFLLGAPKPGSCLQVIKGITGTSKTVTAKRALQLLGPQVSRFGEEPTSLWKSATHLSWLFIGMSHDGSRGGLLNAILLAIDAALKTTNYARDLPKQFRSIDSLIGGVIALLHTLYLGILVIDEIQLLNLVDSEHAPKMHLFLLSLANSGIPLVLVGNPLGFTWLDDYSQNMTRAIERPPIYFHPCGALADPELDEWNFVDRGIQDFYVLDHAPERELCSTKLKVRGGGIARTALTLWCHAQMEALLDGRMTVTPADIEDAYQDPAFAPARPLCDGFADRNPALLMRWRDKDIPVAFYAKEWGTKLVDGYISAPVQPERQYPAETPKRTRSEVSKLKAKQTRERNKQAARRVLEGQLSPEDMRMEGMKAHALSSLDELMKQLESRHLNPSHGG